MWPNVPKGSCDQPERLKPQSRANILCRNYKRKRGDPPIAPTDDLLDNVLFVWLFHVRYGFEKWRHMVLDDPPDDFQVDSKIDVNNHIPQASNLPPFNRGILTTYIVRNVLDRFTIIIRFISTASARS